MAEHGGYRKPAHPAPVSGPGALSRRTDGGPGQPLRVPDGLPYGDRQGLMDQERTAPMAQAPSVSTPNIPPPSAGAPGAPAGGGGPAYTGPGFGEPTQRPNEPITHGVDIGPGGGPEVLPPAAQPGAAAAGPMTQMLGSLPLSGDMAALYAAASSLGV